MALTLLINHKKYHTESVTFDTDIPYLHSNISSWTVEARTSVYAAPSSSHDVNLKRIEDS